MLETHSVSAGLGIVLVSGQNTYGSRIPAGGIRNDYGRRGAEAFHKRAASRVTFQRSNRVMPWLLPQKIAPTLAKDKILLVNLSGRGDKDMHTVAEKSGMVF